MRALRLRVRDLLESGPLLRTELEDRICAASGCSYAEATRMVQGLLSSGYLVPTAKGLALAERHTGDW